MSAVEIRALIVVRGEATVLEGLDLDILRSLDFTRFRPRLVCVETLVDDTRLVQADIVTLVSPTADAIEVPKRIRARPETVFAFLTEAALYQRWKGREAQLDARPGGIYRVVMPGGVALGEYHIVEAPRRVVFSWGWEGNPDVPPGSRSPRCSSSRRCFCLVLRRRR